MPLIECVPNFSEGRNQATIQAIAAAIEAVEGVKLLNVDPGKATNRTVYTFVGEPGPVCEAAFQSAMVASTLIDMRTHSGEHPRFGFIDVCPLIPVSGISMEETALLASNLGRRFAKELGMTVFLYENSAATEERRNLAFLREGEYEMLPEKLKELKPDFGPDSFNEKLGATAVGARDFLIAYNINLNTTSTRRANAIAFDVREKGRMKDGVNVPGTLKAVKAIGWYIEEYGVAQISMNLTNIRETPIHVAFDEVCRCAEARGIRVTGSELVGLIPLGSMIEAGRYFLRKQQRSVGVADSELIKIAIKSMGLDELSPFDPNQRIIEYAIRENRPMLVDLSVRRFVEETASESPAPGGGSVAATMGAMGAALATMVANLSAHKKGWDERWEEFSIWAEKGKALHEELLTLIDADTDAFNEIMAAFALPKGPERSEAIQNATKHAIEVPLRVMEVSLASMDVIEAMARDGNPNSVSDAGVGALAARSAVLGAHLNVKINCASLKDEEFKAKALERAQTMASSAIEREEAILKLVDHAIVSS